MKVHHKRKHGESIAFVEVVCDGCGADFERRECHENLAEGTYCSDCGPAGGGGKRDISGENNPRWSGGVTDTNHKGDWHPKRKKALERANHTCEDPSCSRDTDGEMQIDVHHIIPKRFTEDEYTHDLDNLLVLCKEHHREVEPAPKLKIPLR